MQVKVGDTISWHDTRIQACSKESLRKGEIKKIWKNDGDDQEHQLLVTVGAILTPLSTSSFLHKDFAKVIVNDDKDWTKVHIHYIAISIALSYSIYLYIHIYTRVCIRYIYMYMCMYT